MNAMRTRFSKLALVADPPSFGIPFRSSATHSFSSRSYPLTIACGSVACLYSSQIDCSDAATEPARFSEPGFAGSLPPFAINSAILVASHAWQSPVHEPAKSFLHVTHSVILSLSLVRPARSLSLVVRTPSRASSCSGGFQPKQQARKFRRHTQDRRQSRLAHRLAAPARHTCP
jgi:hypothetical protein